VSRRFGVFTDGGIGEFLAHLKTLADGGTTIDRSSGECISITYKRARR